MTTPQKCALCDGEYKPYFFIKRVADYWVCKFCIETIILHKINQKHNEEQAIIDSENDFNDFIGNNTESEDLADRDGEDVTQRGSLDYPQEA